jgi:hypothetical protein
VLLVFGLILVTSSAGPASPAGAQDARAYSYTFRVVDFSATATLTYASTAATIRYRLLKPSDPKTIYYLGSRPTNPGAAWKLGYAGPILDVAAEATYLSPDPSCTSTIQYRPSGNRIVQVVVELLPRIRAKQVSASVSRLPLAEPHPGEDGTNEDYSTKPRPKCGKPDMGGWYQDMKSVAPATQVGKSRLTLTSSHREKFTDPGIESIDWKLRIVLQRMSFRRIDCARHPGC